MEKDNLINHIIILKKDIVTLKQIAEYIGGKLKDLSSRDSKNIELSERLVTINLMLAEKVKLYLQCYGEMLDVTRKNLSSQHVEVLRLKLNSKISMDNIIKQLHISKTTIN